MRRPGRPLSRTRPGAAGCVLPRVLQPIVQASIAHAPASRSALARHTARSRWTRSPSSAATDSTGPPRTARGGQVGHRAPRGLAPRGAFPSKGCAQSRKPAAQRPGRPGRPVCAARPGAVVCALSPGFGGGTCGPVAAVCRRAEGVRRGDPSACCRPLRAVSSGNSPCPRRRRRCRSPGAAACGRRGRSGRHPWAGPRRFRAAATPRPPGLCGFRPSGR